MKKSPISKGMAATAIAASALGGVAAGAAFFTPTVAGAQDEVEETTERTSRLSDALQGLVDDGTITDSQRDAVVDTLETAREEFRGERGDRGPRGQRGFGGSGVVAEILGLDGAEIREALQGGATIADLAEQQGVSTDDIVDAMVAQAEERVNGALENGRIDDAQAAEILERAEEKAEDIVNGEFEFEGRRGGFGRGFGGPGAGDAGTDTDTSA